MTTTTCACGLLNWHGDVLSIIQDGIHHHPEGLICFETGDDIWAIAPEGFGELA